METEVEGTAVAETADTEAAARMQAALRIHTADAESLTMRRFFWCTRKKKRNKKKQELAAGEC